MDEQRDRIIAENVLIFYSQEDSCWIAHGLHTDQVGTGISVLDALTDAIRAIDAVLLIARDDLTVAYLREAPEDIQEKARTAPLLPREIYDIAHRRVRGEWPQEIPVEITPGKDQVFTTMISEEARC